MVINLDLIGKRLEGLLNLIMNDPDLYSPTLSQFFNNHSLLSLIDPTSKYLRGLKAEAKRCDISLNCKVL